MTGEINFGLLNTNSPMQAADAFNQGVNERRQNRLAELQMQQAEQQATDDASYRDAYKQSGGDLNALLRNLMAKGQYKQANEVQKQMLDQQAKQATIAQTTANTSKTTNDIAHQKFSMFRDALVGVNTPQDAAEWLKGQYSDPDTGAVLNKMGTYESAVQRIPSGPAAFAQWRNQAAMGMEKFVAANKPTTQVQNLGNRSQIVSVPGMGGAPTVLSSSPIGMNPGTAAQLAQSERHFQINQAKDNAPAPEAGLGPDDLKTLAEQYRAGDTSVFTNLGRGRQGAANIIALRKEIGRQTREAGLTGADIAASNAEYFGTKAGQRTVGTRTANVELATNEASQLLPLAREASAEVSRSGLLPFGKAQIMFDNQTNDPKLRQFAAANNSLINVYARAISPSGVPTVADKEHAREMLSTAMDNRSYNAVLDQMEREMAAARKAPGQVRRSFSNAVTKRSDEPSAHSPKVVDFGSLR